MASTNMTIYINSTALPAFATIKQIINPNATETLTLDGTLFVDMINTRRSWQLDFGDLLSIVDYTTIKNIYDLQFSSQSLPYLYVPGLSINLKVYLKLNERNLKFSNQWVEGLQLTALEVFGIS